MKFRGLIIGFIIVGILTNIGFVFGEDIKYGILWKRSAGDSISSVAITSDGNYIVAGSHTNAYLFDKNGNLIWVYNTGNKVNSVAITPDGNYIVVGGDSDNVYLLNKNKDLLCRYSTEDRVNSVAITSDGNYIVAGDYGNIYLFNKKGEFLWKYETEDSVNSVAITPDGNYIVVGCDNDNVYLFNKGYEVRSGETTTVSATLTEETGSLFVESDPSGAEIYIDGDYKGKTPKTISELSPGTHTLKLRMDGYSDYTKDVEIKTGETTNVYVKLESVPITDTNDNVKNNGNNINTLMILLFLGLIAVGGGIYFITKKKKQNK
ncbi:PEGA domain-containing protein [Methanocaldococcus sp.]